MYHLGHLTRLRELNIADNPERAFGVLTVGVLSLHQFSQNDENRVLLPNAIERATALEKTLDAEVSKVFRAVGSVVSRGLIDRISRELAEFETSLDDDLRRLPTYYVEKIGAYSSDDLISTASNVFPSVLFEKIPSQAIEDFKMAGRCLVFEAGTACGFHVFRATDAMLREYCTHFNAIPKNNSRDWGTFIRSLREVLEDKAASKKPNLRTVELIDSIRAQDRNPLVHPELNLDSDGALLIFDLCKNVVSLMAMDIKNSP